jgi:hypothetical protein
MISDELLTELKLIMLEDYEIQLTDNDLRLFADNLKGLFAQFIESVKRKPEKLKLIINKNDNDNQSTTSKG